MTELSEVKQNTYKHKDKSSNLKYIKKYKLEAQPGCLNCFQ